MKILFTFRTTIAMFLQSGVSFLLKTAVCLVAQFATIATLHLVTSVLKLVSGFLVLDRCALILATTSVYLMSARLATTVIMPSNCSSGKPLIRAETMDSSSKLRFIPFSLPARLKMVAAYLEKSRHSLQASGSTVSCYHKKSVYGWAFKLVSKSSPNHRWITPPLLVMK